MYFQNDKRWNRLRWYDPMLNRSVSALTRAAHEFPGALIGTEGEESTIGESGCWHVAIASMLKRFNQKYNGRHLTPKVLLQALRDEEMGTMSGYVNHPFVDPLSILTKNRVQLSSYRDFGEKGVTASSPELREMLECVDGREFCGIVNVESHEFFGRKDPHYVLVYGASPSAYLMHDPGYEEKDSLFGAYERVYQVTTYRLVGD